MGRRVRVEMEDGRIVVRPVEGAPRGSGERDPGACAADSGEDASGSAGDGAEPAPARKRADSPSPRSGAARRAPDGRCPAGATEGGAPPPSRRDREARPPGAPAVGEPLVVCENVSRIYHLGGEDVYAVRDVSCEIPPDAWWPSGDAPARARRPSSTSSAGWTSLPGDAATSWATRRRGCTTGADRSSGATSSASSSSPSPCSVLSAFENVELPLRIAGVVPGSQPAHHRAAGAGGLGRRMHHRPSSSRRGSRSGWPSPARPASPA